MNICGCGCGAELVGEARKGRTKRYASPACRKRAGRSRSNAQLAVEILDRLQIVHERVALSALAAQDHAALVRLLDALDGASGPVQA